MGLSGGALVRRLGWLLRGDGGIGRSRRRGGLEVGEGLLVFLRRGLGLDLDFGVD